MAGASRNRAPTLQEETAWLAAAALGARTYGLRAAEVIDTGGRARRAHQGSPLLLARRAAIYLASTGANLSARALCRATGLDHSTIERHLAVVEDDRAVRAELDALLDELTARLQAVAPTMGRAA